MAAVVRLKDLAESTTDVFNVRPDLIEIEEGFNLRRESPELAAHILWLKDQMLEHGFLRSAPLIVRMKEDKSAVVVVNGHCRFTAAKLAMAEGMVLETIPCVSEGRGVDRVKRLDIMVASNTGLGFSPIEMADGVRRYLSFGLSEVAIAKKFGKSRQWVENVLDLAESPPEVIAAVEAGNIKPTEAVKLVRSEGGPGAVALIAEAKNHTANNGAKAGRITAAVIEKTRAATKPKPAPVAPSAPARFPVVDGNSGVSVGASVAHAPVLEAEEPEARDVFTASRQLVNLWANMCETQPEKVRDLPPSFAAAMIRLRESLA
jgi:ParB-like chromosome segregation protein Spo0J